MKKFITVLALCSIALPTLAQQSTDEEYRSNIIKLDITAYWLYRNALNLTYERMITPKQSLAITAGYQEFPRRRSLSQYYDWEGDNNKYGLKFGAEYRFYLTKENKYHAPHGIYLGPYFSNHTFYNDQTITVTNNGTPEEVTMISNLNIFNVGAEVGYQFIIGDRWVVDMVIAGPSLSNYRIKLKMEGNSFNSEDLLNDILIELIDRFPTIGDAIDDGEGVSNGKLDLWYYGWRYQCHVGYYFGRKK